MSEDRTCPVCGETAPEPASLCLSRIARLAVQGEPCDYSLEGEARFAAEIGGETAGRINAVLSAPPLRSTVRRPTVAENRTCPVCGETAPTAWICVTRLAGVAKLGEPCGYSVEGDERGNRSLNAASERLAASIADQWKDRTHGA